MGQGIVHLKSVCACCATGLGCLPRPSAPVFGFLVVLWWGGCWGQLEGLRSLMALEDPASTKWGIFSSTLFARCSASYRHEKMGIFDFRLKPQKPRANIKHFSLEVTMVGTWMHVRHSLSQKTERWWDLHFHHIFLWYFVFFQWPGRERWWWGNIGDVLT